MRLLRALILPLVITIAGTKGHHPVGTIVLAAAPRDRPAVLGLCPILIQSSQNSVIYIHGY
jgi:hypothetical protein